MRIALDEGSCTGMWPLPDGRLRWSFELTDPAFAELLRDGGRRQVVEIGGRAHPEVAESALAELLEPRVPWFDSPITEVLWSIAIRFQKRMASPLGRGRGWLAGDSAHQSLPVGMHSMNMGLEEAYRLASAIADREAGTATAQGLAAYDRERTEELRFMLGADDTELVARGEANDWVRAERGRLVECVPACGDDLVALLRQLGLERVS
jgi:2-polyprenyl-6-methoxyphenol hydroxylase-like FAD-dependent oxidoreductase